MNKAPEIWVDGPRPPIEPCMQASTLGSYEMDPEWCAGKKQTPDDTLKYEAVPWPHLQEM